MSIIDHMAEAGVFLGNIEWGNQGSDYLAAAQVHATLALVAAQDRATEQARIANLIALKVATPASPYVVGDNFEGDPMWTDIAAALEIGDPS